jgi:hypothetical protein
VILLMRTFLAKMECWLDRRDEEFVVAEERLRACECVVVPAVIIGMVAMLNMAGRTLRLEASRLRPARLART